MSNVVVSDTSCLIVLDKINKLEILKSVFTTVTTTAEVQKEFGKLLPTWITIQSVKNKNKFTELHALLDEGEASSIALARAITVCKSLERLKFY